MSRNSKRIWTERRGGGSRRVGDEGWEWGDRGEQGKEDNDDAEERNAVRSFVSSSPEKEVGEPWSFSPLS